MKLSEAMRLGAMLKPQGFGVSAMQPDKSCALIAACDALSFKHSNEGVDELNKRFVFMQQKPKCPQCGGRYHFAIGGMCAHLNDDHRWTREQIADWVETIESPQSVDAVRQPSDRAVSPVRV